MNHGFQDWKGPQNEAVTKTEKNMHTNAQPHILCKREHRNKREYKNIEIQMHQLQSPIGLTLAHECWRMTEVGS